MGLGRQLDRHVVRLLVILRPEGLHDVHQGEDLQRDHLDVPYPRGNRPRNLREGGRSPSKSPGRGTPGRGIPSNRGKTPVVGAGRSIPPMLPNNPGPTPGTSGLNTGRRPGQPGFVKRGGGGGSGVVRSTDGGYKLPSFSSDDTEPMDDDENENEEEEEMDVEEDDEVDFPNLGAQNQPLAQNIPLRPKAPVAAKNINLIRAPK